MRVAGVCDTDLQLAAGYMGFRGVPGHEMVGDVVEADDAAWIGARVVADINAGCGTCADCVEADGHHCGARTVVGILGRDGAFAEELVVPERNLVRVPAGLVDERAVFAEPLAAALHVLDEVGDEEVVVLGDGKLGLLTTLALASAGRRVTLVGHHPEKLDVAGSAARTVLERDLGNEPLAAAVVEATGSAAGVARALSMVRPRGTVVLKTTISGTTTLDLSPIVINELTVVGSRCGDMRRAIDVLARGVVVPDRLVTARFPLVRADAALARAGEPGVLKVLLDVANG